LVKIATTEVLAEAKQEVQHYGKGSNASRQEGPHVHMVQFSQTKSLFYRMIWGMTRCIRMVQSNASAAALK
jgi:6-phosphogluconolactonase